MIRSFIAVLILSTSLSLNGFSSDTVIKESADTEAINAAKEKAVFESWYRKYYRKYAYVDGTYVKLPNFDFRYKNSRGGKPIDKLLLYSRGRYTYSDGSHSKWTWERRPPEEVKKIRREYYTRLPSWHIGNFGFVEDEGLKISQIIDLNKMIVVRRNLLRGGSRLVERLPGEYVPLKDRRGPNHYVEHYDEYGDDTIICLTGWPTDRFVDGNCPASDGIGLFLDRI